MYQLGLGFRSAVESFTGRHRMNDVMTDQEMCIRIHKMLLKIAMITNKKSEQHDSVLVTGSYTYQS